MKDTTQFTRAALESLAGRKLEKIFVAKFDSADVLFLKPEYGEPMAFELPKEFTRALKSRKKT
jgi:hypothetical protein